MPQHLNEISGVAVKKSYLDSLRGLAALIVVFTHFAGAFYPFSLFGTPYKPLSSLEPVFNQSPLGLLVAGNFAVCLFFILSGYVLSYKFIGRNNTRIRIVAAIFKRPLRLSGVVIFTIILSYIIMRFGLYYNEEVSQFTGSIPWFSQHWETTPLLKQFLADLTTQPFVSGRLYNPPLWTIDIELWGSYLVFLYLFFVSNARYRNAILVLLMILFRNSFYLCFLLGISCAELETAVTLKGFKFSNRLLLGTLIVGLLLSSSPHYVNPVMKDKSIYGRLPSGLDDLGSGGYALIGAFIVFVCVIFYEPIQTLLNKKFFSYLGNISYAMYALHFIFLGSVSSLIYCDSVKLLGHHLAFLLTFIVSLPLMIICADFTNRWVDRPVIRVSTLLGKRCESLGFKVEQFIAKIALLRKLNLSKTRGTKK